MKRIQQGFTLIELMLVLVVLAVIATSGLAAYKQKIQSTKIEQTALQMQQILQAAQGYYVTNSKWPTKYTDFNAYLVGTPFDTCPWLTPAAGEHCYTIATTTATDYKYQIKLTLPATLTNANSVAQMIVGHLPNAVISSSTPPVEITAAVPKAPVLPSNQEAIRGVYSVLSGTTIQLANDCSSSAGRPYQVVYLLLSAYTGPRAEGNPSFPSHPAAGYIVFSHDTPGGRSPLSTMESCFVNPQGQLDGSYTQLWMTPSFDDPIKVMDSPITAIEVCQATAPAACKLLNNNSGQSDNKLNAYF